MFFEYLNLGEYSQPDIVKILALHANAKQLSTQNKIGVHKTHSPLPHPYPSVSPHRKLNRTKCSPRRRRCPYRRRVKWSVRDDTSPYRVPAAERISPGSFSWILTYEKCKRRKWVFPLCSEMLTAISTPIVRSGVMPVYQNFNSFWVHLFVCIITCFNSQRVYKISM